MKSSSAKMKWANNACTRLVGVGAFLGSFLAPSWFRQSGVLSSRPPAGNASRWAEYNEFALTCRLFWTGNLSIMSQKPETMKKSQLRKRSCLLAISIIVLVLIVLAFWLDAAWSPYPRMLMSEIHENAVLSASRICPMYECD